MGAVIQGAEARSILLVLLDGVADRTYPELGHLTPLESAETPNLDRLARLGASASVYPIEPGVAPPSELAHFHLFGYATEPFPGRAVLEALGHGVEVPDGAVVTHAGLRSVTRSADGFAIADWWPREDDAECAELIRAVGPFHSDGVTVTLDRLRYGDALATLRGGSECIGDSDPFFFTGWPVAQVEPLDDAPDADVAHRTARAVNAWLLHTHGVLDAHPVNAARKRRRVPPMNMFVTKWTGRRRALPPFRERTGLPGAIVASTAVYAGLAALLGMRYVHVDERLDDPEKETAQKLEAARELLAAGAGFVHLHTKAADEAAHTHSPVAKRDAIAAIDRGLRALWHEPDVLARTVVAVTADHATPSLPPMLHSGDSVPVAVLAPTVRVDGVTTFGERAAVAGSLGQLRARDVLPILLNAADRARFAGGRLTAHAGLGAARPRPLYPDTAHGTGP